MTYNELLKLARDAIKCELNRDKVKVNEEVKKKYCNKGACFVTLTINGELRGCIGSLQAHQELWRDIIDNSNNAAFNDPRFLPLSKNELDKTKIEISVLTTPKKLEYKDEKDLLDKIDKKMGLILKKGFCQSTFLPQVWEQIPDKIEFLEYLSRKAGLSKNDWKDCEVWFYRVEKIKEK